MWIKPFGIMKGSIATAVYGLAAQVNTYYQTFSCAISTVFTPRVHKMISSGCSDLEISDLFIKVGRIQFVVLALMVSGITLFGKTVFQFWGGADYQDSYYIAILLIWPVTIPLFKHGNRNTMCKESAQI
jgi:O-antigen/teichoic acid export membrane protein